MSNYYAQAIQVLADPKTDFRALAYEIAKANPKAVATAAKRVEVGFGWQTKAEQMMRAGLRLEAIKECRNQTGMSLVDAKNACEALI